MTVAMVLDVTAVLAYSKGSIHVGEPVAMLSEERDRTFAVSVISLAEGAATAENLDQLRYLGQHELGDVTPVMSDGWQELVKMSQLLGSVDYAVPFLTAKEHEAYLLTATPERYPESDRIIDIGH